MVGYAGCSCFDRAIKIKTKPIIQIKAVSVFIQRRACYSIKCAGKRECKHVSSFRFRDLKLKLYHFFLFKRVEP